MAKRILFLMSDTGGGHRAAAEAILEALHQRHGTKNISGHLLDVFKAINFPLNYMPEFYPWLVNRSKTSWGMGYNFSNTRRRAAALARGMYLSNARRFRQIAEQYPADVVVSVHSVITRPTMDAYNSLLKRPPFITVVTDLVSTHMFWYDRRVERTLVPTEAAFERGLQSGLRPESMRITGLPVDPRFLNQLTDQDEARAELGWEPDKPTILMVAGGEGMGPLFDTARAINTMNLDCQLVIIAGRNRILKNKLEAQPWNQPTHVYPFVTNMPRMMAAANIIVTKAGPATLTEAAIAGLPMIISDAIPGQEDGNVQYVIENNAGIYAPEPALVADTVGKWLSEGPEGLARRAAAARRIGRPNAVWDIADEVWEWANKPPVTSTSPRRSLWDKVGNFVSI